MEIERNLFSLSLNNKFFINRYFQEENLLLRLWDLSDFFRHI